jgi:hypothetical protein
MKNLLAFLTASIFILQSHLAYTESREKLGLIYPAESCLVGSETSNDMVIRYFDTDEDGNIDFSEVLDVIETEPGNYRIRGGKPSLLWYDKNKNQRMDEGEVYESDKRNEDWKKAPKRLFSGDNSF